MEETKEKNVLKNGDQPLLKPVKPIVKPIVEALSLLSRRWVLRILWELKTEPSGFREMQARCENLSPNTLSTRLSEMKDACLIEQSSDGRWQLSVIGKKLQPALMQVNDWSHEWVNTRAKSKSD